MPFAKEYSVQPHEDAGEESADGFFAQKYSVQAPEDAGQESADEGPLSQELHLPVQSPVELWAELVLKKYLKSLTYKL